MTEIVPIARLDMSFEPKPWPFAERRRAEIDAHFAERNRQTPALWNGQVLVLGSHEVDGSTFRGSYLQTDYASFLSWHDWGRPETGVRDCFAQAAICSADGAFLLGVMGSHTANAGYIYFPSGTPDPSDIVGDKVDLEASLWREVAEETGLTASDITADEEWHAVFVEAHIAMIRVVRAREDAVALRERILRFLAKDKEPELADIRIVRGPADLDPRMRSHVSLFLSYIWARPS
jgi:8-oxo-dGTP pyrophosphatase MutT (NUDIX family)